MIGVLLLVTKATASKSPASKVILLVLKGGRGRNPRSLVKFCRQNCATYFYSLFFAMLTSSRVIASTVLAACK